MRAVLAMVAGVAVSAASTLFLGFSWTSPSAEIGLRLTLLAINAVQLELRGLRNTKSVASTCAFSQEIALARWEKSNWTSISAEDEVQLELEKSVIIKCPPARRREVESRLVDGAGGDDVDVAVLPCK